MTEKLDPLEIIDVRRHQTDSLRDLLAGRSAFLVCGGPSAKPHLEKLNRRGVFALAVNNAAGNVARVQAFICADPPMKFSHSIWMDPGIMKFVPTPKMTGSRKRLREKSGGAFFRSEKTVVQCPNVWGFRREHCFKPDDSFFSCNGAVWGNLDAGVKETGGEKTVCTMLLGIRMLAYLGVSRIHLLGVDFHMAPDYGYSFDQKRNEGASRNNNGQFAVVNEWLCKMQSDGVFERRGVELYNTNECSGLRAFGYVPFEDALKDVVGLVEEEPDLEGWYEKAHCPKCRAWKVKFGEICHCMKCGHEYDSYNKDEK